MVKYENDCCSCAVPAYPCLGNDCPNKNVPHYYCDICGTEAILYHINDSIQEYDLCIDCLDKILDNIDFENCEIKISSGSYK